VRGVGCGGEGEGGGGGLYDSFSKSESQESHFIWGIMCLAWSALSDVNFVNKTIEVLQNVDKSELNSFAFYKNRIFLNFKLSSCEPFSCGGSNPIGAIVS
jgi:hypothetical protein